MEFTKRTITSVLLLATLAVLGHWNVWDDGIYALGWNTTAFWFTTITLLWRSGAQRDFRRDKYWLLPLLGIALSYTLFENPWLKLISCAVLPVTAGVFFAYGQLVGAQTQFWGVSLLKSLGKRAASPMKYFFKASGFIKSHFAVSFGEADTSLAKRIMLGVVLLIPIAIVVLMLLTSADEKFSQLIGEFGDQLLDLLNFSIFAKVFWIFVIATILFATIHAWKTPLMHTQAKQIFILDDVVVGIVMSGILLIYFLFLWLQLDYLVVNELPSDFSQVERLVKSGFWQLFFLSILNAGLFFVVYKNTGTIAQLILRVFIVASGLLLLSAAWRMGLYVYWYGLSYEKFFASYTTVFALAVFVYLLVASLSKKRKDVFKFIAFAALWSYSIASLMPVEKIIFHSNLQLAELDGSHINLGYLRDLSLDVVADVERELIQKPRLERPFDQEVNWQSWVRYQQDKYCQRAWYEWRLSLLVNCK